MKTGLDVLIANKFAPLKGKRVGLVTHTATLAQDFRSTVEVFTTTTECKLVALFGPEHGLTGEAQDLIPVKADGDGPVRLYSLYGDTFESLKPTAAMLDGLDVLVIDLQDVGSRYYTFQATMLYCMEACAAVGLPVMVLDRPNPIGRAVEGPTVRPGFESFVGVHPIATRHGMTIGELAQLYKAERVPNVNLTVIACKDYVPSVADVWTLPPSPNMPTTDTAEVYPGMCLIEGTNLSEGRGTTRPFEYVGFPGADHRAIAAMLNADADNEYLALPVQYRPTFQKHAGQTCNGIFLVVGDSDTFQPVRMGLAVVIAFRKYLGERFWWRTEVYEFVSHIPAIDILFGSDRERTMIEGGATWREIAALWKPEEAAFRERRKQHLIYE
ncbi:DUF1343 domain-containing protein [soil metagenome]